MMRLLCKDARIDASLRVSVGLEPPPPQQACGWTHRHLYAGDPPPSSARAGDRPCHPARTVAPLGDSDWGPRPAGNGEPAALIGPGQGIGHATPPGRC